MPTLAVRAAQVASEQKGRGENCPHRDAKGKPLRHNNCGPWVETYRRDKKREAWCAAFVSWCYETAWIRQHGYQKWTDTPLEVRKACPLKRSSGARRLCEPLKKVDSPQVGDIALWARGAANASTGHVGIVVKISEDGATFWCWEGNKGSYPSTVKLFEHAFDEGNFLGFYRV